MDRTGAARVRAGTLRRGRGGGLPGPGRGGRRRGPRARRRARCSRRSPGPGWPRACSRWWPGGARTTSPAPGAPAAPRSSPPPRPPRSTPSSGCSGRGPARPTPRCGSPCPTGSWRRTAPDRVATTTDLLLRPDVDHALPVVDDGDLRAILTVGKPGRPVTAADRALVAEIGAGARLLLRVVARGAELRARVARADELARETEASRRRLGRARELERHRLVGELGGATTERLAGFRAAVTAAVESVDEGLEEPEGDPAREEAAEFARHHLTTARERLEELLDRFRVIARGVHPAVLRDQGPRAALEEVVADLPRAVHLTGRLAAAPPLGGRVGALLRRGRGAGPARRAGGGGAAGAGPRAGRRPRRGPGDRRDRRPRRHPHGPRRRRRPARRPRRVPRAHRRRRRAHGAPRPPAHAAAPARRDRAARMSTERLRLAAFWVVFATVSALTLVWLTVGALVTTPLNEPPGQAVVDYLASAVNLVVAVVLLRFGGRSWSGRLLALAMVGSAGAFNLQAHSATMAVQDTTGIEHRRGPPDPAARGGGRGVRRRAAARPGRDRGQPAAAAGRPRRRRVVLFAPGVGTALLPHTVSCVVFFGFLVPLLGVGAIAPAVRRAPTPEARARARLHDERAGRRAWARRRCSRCSPWCWSCSGRPGLTLDDPTARHSALGGEPTALLFWFARLTAAVIALAVLAARRARPAERVAAQRPRRARRHRRPRRPRGAARGGDRDRHRVVGRRLGRGRGGGGRAVAAVQAPPSGSPSACSTAPARRPPGCSPRSPS